MNRDSLLKNIGIDIRLPEKRIKGDLYEAPEDFIVREIHREEICSIDKENLEIKYPIRGKYIHAVLVKKDISTFEACKMFAEANGLDYFNDISVCGLKDTFGVTSQKICIRNYRKIKLTIFEKFFLKNFHGSSKKLCVGDHIGNNFIVTLRNVETNKKEINEILKNIESGLPNFYWFQRFGVRQNNHILGKLLIQKRYEEFIFHFLTDSTNEGKRNQILRRYLAENFGDWDICFEIIKNMDLSDEKELLTYLCKYSSPEKAIKKMKLARFFVHAYVSYLFNKALSKFIKENGYKQVLIEKIGRNTRLDSFNKQIYKEILENEGLTLTDIKNSVFTGKNHLRHSIFYPKNLYFSNRNENLMMSFDLGKGEYASLVLEFLVDSNKIKWC